MLRHVNAVPDPVVLMFDEQGVGWKWWYVILLLAICQISPACMDFPHARFTVIYRQDDATPRH